MSIKHRPDGVWRARFRDEEGREHSRHFRLRKDGTNWLAEVASDLRTGTLVDRKAGLVTFEVFAEEWRSLQVHRDSTAKQVRTNLTRHVYPILGAKPINTIRPTHIQGLVKTLSLGLAPATVELVYRYVVTIFGAAVADNRLKSTPCVNVKLPRIDKPKVVPLSTEIVQGLIDGVPPRYRALLVLARGTGLRSGELRGLSLDSINFFRRTVTVERQLVNVRKGEAIFGPPKTPTSHRTVPLSDSVVDALVAHHREFGVGDDHLFFTTKRGLPISRSHFSAMWRPVARSLGLYRDSGLHDLRHFYTSLLIHRGASVKAVQDCLGHKSAIETLDTYGHLWPNSDDSIRAAIDAVVTGLDDAVSTFVHAAPVAGNLSGVRTVGGLPGRSHKEHPGQAV